MSSRPLIQIIPDANIPVIWEDNIILESSTEFSLQTSTQDSKAAAQQEAPEFPELLLLPFPYLRFGAWLSRN